jgi:ATP-dependent DNA helicase PIF1
LTAPFRNTQDPKFANWVDRIGNGQTDEVEMSMLKSTLDMEEIINFVYPQEILASPVRCLSRAILAPTNLQIDMYNDTILKRIVGETHTYVAADSLKEADESNLGSPTSVLDYVSHHAPQGTPPHSVLIKVNSVFRLLRNFSVNRGIIKNACVIITGIGVHLVTIKKLIPNALFISAKDILIPCISFTANLSSSYTLTRQQFLLAPSYATTFNSCQGMTLDKSGLDLTRDVFSHGQLYTTFSCIRRRHNGMVRLNGGQTSVKNVTYRELLL